MNNFCYSLRINTCWLLGLAAWASAYSARAQNTLEFFSGAGNTTASGPVVTNQVVTFQNNTDNPTASDFATYSPTTTATFVLSNQQYGPSDASRGVMFGAQSNTGGTSPNPSPIFPLMNGLGSSSNGNYTSGNTAGSGIDITVNRSVALATDVQYVATSTAAARLPYANLTITFNRAVVNPVLHLTGLGTPGNGQGTVGSATEFDVLTSGVTLSELSGSSVLSVSGNSIVSTSTAPASATSTGTSTTGAASGSVLVTTPSAGITTLQLQVFLRKLAGTLSTGGSYTDGWLIGISVLTPATALPVTLVSFTAQALPTKAAQLTWATASELGNDHFEVERSLDGTVFQKVGQVARQGSKAGATTYTFTEAGVGQLTNEPVYYRLRQVDLDGTSTYPPVRTVVFTAAAASISLAPNPTAGTANLDLTQLPAGSYHVAVLDLMGRTLLRQELAAGLVHTLPVAQLPGGHYLVVVRNADFHLNKRLSKF